jgi:large subunit ribosomal protein L29
MATAKELSELTVDDLRRRAIELRESLFQDQLKLRTGTLDNPMERTNHRRDLARVLTVLTQKTAPQAPAPQAAAPSPPPPELVAEASAKKPKARARASKS